MLRPGLWIIIGLALSAGGLLLGWSALSLVRNIPIWETLHRTYQTISFLGFLATVGGLVLAGIAWAVWRKREALRAGTGLLARWRVGLLDWAAFRRRDAARDTLFHSLRNRLRLPAELPPEGLEIRVGKDALLVGDACYGLGYFASRGKLVDVGLVEGQPEMLEFVTHQVGKNISRLVVFRVPVPSGARDDARRLLDQLAGTFDQRRREKVLAHFAPHFQAATGDAGEAAVARAVDRSRGWRAAGFGLLLTGAIMLGFAAWAGRVPTGDIAYLRLFTVAGGLTAAAGVIALLVSTRWRR